MTSPILSKNPPITVVIDREFFEDIKEMMKERADEVINKSSNEIKTALKTSADAFIEEIAPSVIPLSKRSVEKISPEPFTPIINNSIDTHAEIVSKEVAHQSIDSFVDLGMKRVVDGLINISVDTTHSILSRTYNYIQSWFV